MGRGDPRAAGRAAAAARSRRRPAPRRVVVARGACSARCNIGGVLRADLSRRRSCCRPAPPRRSWRPRRSLLMLMAWALLAERPAAVHLLAGAALGIVGVATDAARGRRLGRRRAAWLASVAAMAHVVAGLRAGQALEQRRRTCSPPPSWQLIAGGLLLVPAAALVEGRAARAGRCRPCWASRYVTVVATALAFVAWFAGLRHLPASAPSGSSGCSTRSPACCSARCSRATLLTWRQLLGMALVLGAILVGRATAPGWPASRWLSVHRRRLAS